MRCLAFLILLLGAGACIREPKCAPGDTRCHLETYFLIYKYPCAVRGYCQMFISTVLPGGATFSGVSGADLLCNSDAGRPSTLPTFKAMIASSSGTIRRASVTANTGDGQVDWVLQPGTQYRRTDGVTVIGTTGSNGLFTFNLTNSPAASGAYWTGLNGSWQNAADCGGWTFTGTALLGNGVQITNAAISAAGQNCNFAGFGLLCVEQ